MANCGIFIVMRNKKNISRRSALVLGTGATVSLIAGSTAGGSSVFAAKTAPIVVELFTSQGCSSCPPADKLLGELSKQKNIIPLSFNVDYWDYLGWRDTLGSSKHTKRQQAYAANRGSRRVYTPQMIINGHVDVVGSRRKQVFAALAKESSPGQRIPMKMSDNGTEITIEVGDSPNSSIAQKATIWILVTAASISVPVKRGENRGKNITYHNVVRQLMPAGTWTGKALKITLPKAGLGVESNSDCVALLQQGMVGKIIGVVRMSDQKV